jgi:hypothetical protein
MLRLN